MLEDKPNRRDFIKKTAYAVPLILSLKAMPAFAGAGSGEPRWKGNNGLGSEPSWRGNNGVGNGDDPQPPGNPHINDGPGTGPGNPGNRGGPKGN
jgi:hypothetical protein